MITIKGKTPKVGDRVIASGFKNNDFKDLENVKGTIIAVGLDRVSVQFDVCFTFGHNCVGRGKDGRCRNFGFYESLSESEHIDRLRILEKNNQLSFDF